MKTEMYECYEPYGVFYPLELIRSVCSNITGPFISGAPWVSLIGRLPGVDF